MWTWLNTAISEETQKRVESRLRQHEYRLTAGILGQNDFDLPRPVITTWSGTDNGCVTVFFP
jgi:hypothetical protein